MIKKEKYLFLICFLIVLTVRAPAYSTSGELTKLSVAKGNSVVLNGGKAAIQFVSLEPTESGSKLVLRIKNMTPTRMTSAHLFIAYNLDNKRTVARTGYKINTMHIGRIISENFEPNSWTELYLEEFDLRTEEVKDLSISIDFR